MNRLLLKLAISAAVGSLLSSNPTGAQLAQLSQPEGQRTGKVNKNNLHNQKVSTTFGLPAVSVRYDPQQ
jgi:hypothetical protein